MHIRLILNMLRVQKNVEKFLINFLKKEGNRELSCNYNASQKYRPKTKERFPVTVIGMVIAVGKEIQVNFFLDRLSQDLLQC